ncbi:MAG: hypothetical protein HC842_03105 [Cytophagales bacterium]|nr:hypothetical protein [Cytophagales bacterium]
MKQMAKWLSYAGLMFSIVPVFLLYAGVISPDMNKALLMTGTGLWLGLAPIWLWKAQ